MPGAAKTWHVERWAPMRADAESIYVATTELPDAATGDRVDIAGHEGGDERCGVIAAADDHDGESFWRIQLDG